MRILLYITLLWSGVATFGQGSPIVDKEFHKYIFSFEKYTGEEVTTNILFTSQLPLSKAGVYSPNAHTIFINRDLWGTMDMMMRYYLIYHEVGHSLGLEHSDKGIMKKALPHQDDDIYQEFKLGRVTLKKQLLRGHDGY